MFSRRYYQYVEKNADRVSTLWKILHVSIFLLTAINSLISAYAFGDILKNFNHRCVLNATPNLNLHEIITKQNDTRNITSEEMPDSRNVSTLPSSEHDHQLRLIDWSKADRVGGQKNVFVLEEQLWFNNSSMSGRISMEYIGTIFGKNFTCDMVLFVPLFSLIVAAVFGVIVGLCGKGGRGHESDVLPGAWSFVYPVIILSALMTLLSMIAAISVSDGLQEFCSNFEQYTGQRSCSYLMDYFSLGKNENIQGFWRNYIICYYSYIFGVLLWAAQLSITVLRLLRVADFQFNVINIEKKINENDDEEKLDKIHKAVVRTYPGVKAVTELVDEDPEEMTTYENGEMVTKV
ncbi:hypothetical protein JTB14_031670 [Gonioctena quinquepunctata]|nr:hypothetical protein JTB14_031670 [Gonioctena quinquepunctata]